MPNEKQKKSGKKSSIIRYKLVVDLEQKNIPESEILINLFLLSFGVILTTEELCESLKILLESLVTTEAEIFYVDDGNFTNQFVDFLICFDSFLVAPHKIVARILELVGDEGFQNLN